MRLLDKLKRNKPTVSDSEIKEIQARVRTMRNQIGNRDIDLADLFALVKEDERPLLREIKEVRRPEIARVWPDQVPALEPLDAETNAPKVTYGDWELLRRKGLVTLP